MMFRTIASRTGQYLAEVGGETVDPSLGSTADRLGATALRSGVGQARRVDRSVGRSGYLDRWGAGGLF